MAKREVLAGFVVRPVYFEDGETTIRWHRAYRRLGIPMLMVSGDLQLTTHRLVWDTLWFVKTIRKDEVVEVTLHRDWWPGLLGHPWRMRIKTTSGTEFFGFKAAMAAFPLFAEKPARQKEWASRWVDLVRHWANPTSN